MEHTKLMKIELAGSCFHNDLKFSDGPKGQNKMSTHISPIFLWTERQTNENRIDRELFHNDLKFSDGQKDNST